MDLYRLYLEGVGKRVIKYQGKMYWQREDGDDLIPDNSQSDIWPEKQATCGADIMLCSCEGRLLVHLAETCRTRVLVSLIVDSHRGQPHFLGTPIAVRYNQASLDR